MKRLLVSISFLFFVVFCFAASGFHQIELTEGWRIKKLHPVDMLSAREFNEIERPDGWIPVRTMPAMIHEILMDNSLMEAYYLPGIAEKYLWVSESDWVYETKFSVTDPAETSFLHFKGLDCIADIYLNGELIATNTNMYYPLRIEVSDKLQKTNKLLLHFHTVFEKQDDKVVPLKTFRGNKIRRPDQNYLNYLGPYPYFSKYGVYGNILLETTRGHEMTNVMAGSSLDKMLKNGKVTVDVEGKSTSRDIRLELTVWDKEHKRVAQTEKQLSVVANAFSGKIELNVSNPNLWWPRGYGDQSLYTAEVKFLIDGKVHQTITKTIGFRRIIQTKLLHFEVNNVPVRLWGGDWVTPRWVTAVWDQARAEKLVRMAEIANFNIFRVWGVVEAPDDRFYELCDRQGFLLWQDFTNMPLGGDEQSLATIRDEAPKFIARLKNHPSVLLWNGGNENALWHHQEYNGQLLDRGEWPGIVGATELGKIVTQFDSERYFQPTSPWLGIDPNDPREGSTHGYTNMWYVPGYDYLNFAAEDTRIAAPILSSCEKFMRKDEIWPPGYSLLYTPGSRLPYPETWLKYTASESWKKTGPVELFYDANNADELIYRIGMAEALYYQNTVEQQRRGRPADDISDERRCGGYIVWKYNDSWPQIYSAKVDYFLEPYHSYYALKRAYEPVLLSFEVGAYIWLWAVNDSRETIKGTVNIELFHPERNEVRKTIEREVELKPGKSKVVVRLDEAGIGSFRREHILHASLKSESGEKIAEAFVLGDIERRMAFPDANIDVSVRGEKLVLKSDKFARAVTLEGDDNGDKTGFLFSDNYFDMMPGEEKVIEILGDKSKGNITVKPHYSNSSKIILWDRYNDR